jgi:uncharacterized membrane protein
MIMFEFIYEMLQKFGYTHPLHPTLTHLPIGLVLAAFVFGLIAVVFRKPSLINTARHCITLALITVPAAVLLGLMDWQHFYGGAWLFPIKMKLALAAGLFVFLLLALLTVSRRDTINSRSLVVYAVCVLLVIGLGYFGGELVYGTSKSKTTGESLGALAENGAVTFDQSCALCHYSDQTETKVGPGLKGLYKKDRMAQSGWKVTDDNVRRQLKTPYADMPPFPDLTEEEKQAIIAYLRSL